MKYAPGLMVGQLSGKAGSTVASRNRNGSYFRTRVIPMLVRNAATEAVRASFTENAQNYRGLTDPQRQAWTALGAGISKRNSLGESYNLTGIQAFNSVNRNRHTIGLLQLSDAPQQVAPAAITSIIANVQGGSTATDTTITAGATSATQTVGSTTNMRAGDHLKIGALGVTGIVDHVASPTSVVLTASVTTVTADVVIVNPNGLLSVAYTPTPVATATYYAFFATPPVSAGISRPTKNAYKLIQVAEPTDASPIDLTAAYNAVAGVPADGQKVFIQAVAISANGFRSTPVETVEIAVRIAP